ncbi:MAG: hypothetical protein HZC44_09385 [Geobacter sp.]|nr:hypothetical protein [Geobacter sp.]
MGIIQIDNLEVGMVLATDVHDQTGRLLLGEGAELTQKHLVVFRTWGVVEVDIAGIDEVDAASHLPDEITPEQLAAAEAELLPLFCNANLDYPVMRELFHLAALRRALHGIS